MSAVPTFTIVNSQNISDQKENVKNKSVIISIIGSSGNKIPLTKDTFSKARDELEKCFLTCGYPLENIILKSGGSSGIDHLAVILFLEGITISKFSGNLKETEVKKFKGLVLNFPCGFDVQKEGFYSLNRYDTKAATLLKELHTNFSKEIGRNTIADIDTCIKTQNCFYDSSMGFFRRNDKVAIADIIIAMTFATGDKPTDGGTLYTWKKAVSVSKLHISLS